MVLFECYFDFEFSSQLRVHRVVNKQIITLMNSTAWRKLPKILQKHQIVQQFLEPQPDTKIQIKIQISKRQRK